MKCCLLLFLITVSVVQISSAQVYREGKPSMSRESKIDVVRMDWGAKSEHYDRIVGTVRLYTENMNEVYFPVLLTFDIYSRHAVQREQTNSPRGSRSTTSLEPEKIGTLQVRCDARRYGYRRRRGFVEYQFSHTFPRNTDAHNIHLSNVRFNNSPVFYRILFNINGSLTRSGFTLQEPRRMR